MESEHRRTSSQLLTEEDGEDGGVADCGCPCGRHWTPIEEEVAKETIKKWSEPCCLIACFRLPDHWYGRHSIHSVYFFCSVLLSISLMAAVYVWFVMCSKCVRIWNFSSTECVLQQVGVNQISFCGCKVAGLAEEVCFENFTCVSIIVRYQTEEWGNVTSQLFETAEDLYWAPPADPHCSFRHSCQDNEERRTHIQGALRTWAFAKNAVRCRYDPLSPGEVFTSEGEYTRTVLIFGAVNVLIVVGCIVVMLVTFTTCGWRYIWARHAPDGIKQEVEKWRHRSGGTHMLTSLENPDDPVGAVA